MIKNLLNNVILLYLSFSISPCHYKILPVPRYRRKQSTWMIHAYSFFMDLNIANFRCIDCHSISGSYFAKIKSISSQELNLSSIWFVSFFPYLFSLFFLLFFFSLYSSSLFFVLFKKHESYIYSLLYYHCIVLLHYTCLYLIVPYKA